MKCPLCFSISDRIFTAKNVHGRRKLSDEVFPVHLCRKCKLVFPQVKFNENYYENYYENNYYLSNQGLFTVLINRISFHFKRRLLRQSKKEGKLLDIGCAKGDFLSAMPDTYKKYGIEINKIGYEFIKKNQKNITVFNEKIEQLSFNEEFDIVTLWHVFEHLSSPTDTLKAIHNCLKLDGTLIIQTPNTNSLGFKLAKDKWFHLDSPRHLFLFNKENLCDLLEQNRFKVIGTKGELIDYPLDLFWDIISSFKLKNKFIKRVSGCFFLLPALLLRLFFILNPRVSETLTIVAKRTG